MADTATIINNNNNNTIQPKLQLRSGLALGKNNDKTPSPATKLLLNHGKPNFTVQRSPKVQENGNENPLTAQSVVNNNYSAYKSANSYQKPNNSILVGTKFNGVFKPTNASLNSGTAADTENEATKVVLRRATKPEPAIKDGEDEQVPEFIRRQRRIQERLAKENVLDFESRRSGYFTHVMISPDSPNRTSFVETMSSPAIVPALEMPPMQVHVEEGEKQVKQEEEKEKEQQQQEEEQVHATPAVATLAQEPVEEVKEVVNEVPVEAPKLETTLTNGHNDVAEADVAQAIEEVNKAVAGEDETEAEAESVVEPVATSVTELATEEVHVPVAVAVVTSAPLIDVDAPIENGHAAAAVIENGHADAAAVIENGHADAAVTENGHAAAAAVTDNEITISHTNGNVSDGPSIPTPDPSGALGVNFEPKTVVSFAQELGGGENKYPDTVKIVKDGELVEKTVEAADEKLQALTKLKFEISGDANDVQVTPVLKTE